MRLRKRRGIMAAIVIFLFVIVFAGMTAIVVDAAIVQPSTQMAQSDPLGIPYDPNTLLFFQVGWAAMAFIVVVGASVWLWQRAQER
jgi:hypothetical protein